MDHTGDDRTVSVLFGNTWQDVNASVYAAVSAIVSSVVNGVDPSLAPRVRKAILTAYMIQSRQTMDMEVVDTVCRQAEAGHLTWQGVERVRRDGKEAGTFVDTMPGYHGGEGADGSVILPFCDGRYRCLICENGIGHNGMGYTDAQHVPCSDRPMHMGVWGCQLGMQSRYGNPCGAGTIPGICTDTEVMYNHYAWSRRYPVGPDGVFPVGRSHIGLHPAMLTIPELARKVRPEDLVVAASNVSKCIPVARYTVDGSPCGVHAFDLSGTATMMPLRAGRWCAHCRDAHARGVGAPPARSVSRCLQVNHTVCTNGRVHQVTCCTGSEIGCPLMARAALAVMDRIAGSSKSPGRCDKILPLCTGHYACLICKTRPVTRAKVAKQLCRDWRAHMPTAQQHGEHAVVHYRECSDTDMMCVACRP
jgi:hypothetical protein